MLRRVQYLTTKNTRRVASSASAKTAGAYPPAATVLIIFLRLDEVAPELVQPAEPELLAEGR